MAAPVSNDTAETEAAPGATPSLDGNDQSRAASSSSQQELAARTGEGAIDPAVVRLFRGPHDVLRCTLAGEKSVLRVKVVRAFPLSHSARWVNLLDGKNKEVCLIEDPDALDPQSSRLVHEALATYYRVITIERIISITNEYRTMYWIVETRLGRRDFVVKWSSETIIRMSETELLLVDIDTNRFRIPDLTALDAHSAKQLDILA